MAIKEDLELDFSKALSDAERLSRSMKSATDVFASGLDASLGVLDNIKISTPDTSNIENAIATSVAEGVTTGAATPADIANVDASAVGGEVVSEIETGAATAVDIANADASVVVDELVTAIDEGSATPVNVSNVDANEVTSSIDVAIQAADTTLQVDANTDEAQAAIEELAGSGRVIEVPVQAPGVEDTTDKVQGLDTAAQAASESGGKLSTALGGVSSLATISTGRVGGLGEAVSKLGPTAAGAAAAVGTLATASLSFFNEALDAQSVTERYNAALGGMAQVVDQVQLGTLNSDISALTLKLGLSDDALRNADASIFQFATSSGFAAPQAAELANNVNALALRAAAGNAAITDIGSAAEGLSNALAVGGRKLKAYNIDLSASEIRAEAARLAVEGIGDGVSQTSLAYAGAQLAAKKYGDSIDRDITAGSQNAAIQVRALGTQFSEAKEAIGGPLVVPIIQIMKDMVPVGISAAKIVGDLSHAALPLVEIFVEVAGGALKVIEAVTNLADNMGILEPLVVGLVAGFAAMKFATFVQGLWSISAATVSTIAQFEAMQAAAVQTGATSSLAFGPVGIAIGALAAAAVIGFNVLGHQTDQAAKRQEKFTADVIDAIPFVQNLGAELITTGDAARQYLDTLANKIESGDTVLSDDTVKFLKEAGVSFQDVGRFAEEGQVGIEKYTAALVESGRITAVETVRNSKGGWKEQEVDLKSLMKTNREATVQRLLNAKNTSDADTIQITNGQKQLTQFEQLRQAEHDSAEAKLQSAVATEKVTQETADLIKEEARNVDGKLNEQIVLEKLNNAYVEHTAKVEADTAAQNAALTPLAGSNAAWLALGNAVAMGSTNLNDPKALLEYAAKLGTTTDQVEEYAAAVNAYIDGIVEEAQKKIPKATDAFKDVETATDPKKIIKNLKEQQAQLQAYGDALNDVALMKFPALRKAILESPPDVGGALAKSFKEATPKVQAEMEALLEQVATTSDNIAGTIEARTPEIELAVNGVANVMTSSLNTTLDFKTATQLNIDAMTLQLGLPENSAAVVAATKRLANAAATSYAENTTLDQKTKEAIEKAGATMKSPTAQAPAVEGAKDLGEKTSAGFDFKAASQIQPSVNLLGSTLKNGQTQAPAVAGAADLGDKTSEGFAGAVNLETPTIEELASVVAFLTNPANAGPANDGAFTIGQAISAGLAAGLEEGTWQVQAAVRKLVALIPATIRNLLGIRSPSRVTMKLGAQTAQGLVDGLESGLPEIVRAAEAIVAAATGPMNAAEFALPAVIASPASSPTSAAVQVSSAATAQQMQPTVTQNNNITLNQVSVDLEAQAFAMAARLGIEAKR